MGEESISTFDWSQGAMGEYSLLSLYKDNTLLFHCFKTKTLLCGKIVKTADRKHQGMIQEDKDATTVKKS